MDPFKQQGKDIVLILSLYHLLPKMSNYPLNKSTDEWKEQLDEKAFDILRKKGTEYPHTGIYNLHFEEGVYQCKGCKESLFSSDSKFESGCGWPSFSEAKEGKIRYESDSSHNMIRIEILCANCGGHLGHVFPDGPTATNRRYCVNSASLDFKA
jgi:peptide-methionine (R)-S-oxide reductase